MAHLMLNCAAQLHIFDFAPTFWNKIVTLVYHTWQQPAVLSFKDCLAHESIYN